MKERFGRSDYRFLAVCLLLFAGAVWYSVRNFHHAFPEASIEFRVSRSEGEAIATRFLQSDVSAYRRASSFAYDDTAKTFLEREAGLDRANRIMGSRVRLWRWSYRWFRPLEKEEYRVDVTPRGEIAGFAHDLAEDAARPAVTAAQARAAAEAFLRDRMKRDPAALEFVDSSEIARPNRVDRSFTWKEPGYVLRDADIRFEVGLHGGDVDSYREYLKVPEPWTRDYQRMRSKNEAASTVDSVAIAGLVVGLLVVIVMRVRGHDILWRRAAVVGVVGMALAFLANLNQMPLDEFHYRTTDSYSSFVLTELLNAALGALAAGGALFVLTAGAEPLYREMFPTQMAVGRLVTARGLRTRRFFLGAVLGLTLTGAAVAYQTVFYIGASKLGAWSPAEVPYDDLLNTRFPWAFVLFGGFFPAVSEEFLFRMFAIPFLRKLFRSLVPAIVVAGLIWGFGHTAYPQQPFYIRGLEVGLDGIVCGFLMLRFGILPLVIEHYSIDAFYSAMLLLRSPNVYLKLSGAASAGIILIPITFALVAYWRNRGFEPETGLLNADERADAPPPPEPEIAPPPAGLKFAPMGRRVQIAAGLLLVAGIAAALIPYERFGDRPKYKLTAGEAIAASDAFLRARGVDPASFQHVAVPMTHWTGGDERAAKYFLERLPLAAASAQIERGRPIQHWRVRYYRPLDQEEISLSVQPETGAILGWRHTLREEQSGADLPETAARPIAAAAGYETTAMDLKESSSDKKKARRDWKFIWEARPGDPRTVGEARYRVEVAVAGDRVSAAGGYWKLPEEYTRGRNRQTAVSIAAGVGKIALLSILIVSSILLLVGFIRNGAVPWRFVLIVAGIAAALGGLGHALGFRLLFADYPSAIPIETFRASSAMGILINTLFGFILAAASAALITGGFPDIRRALAAGGRRVLARDAALSLAAGAGLVRLAFAVDALLVARFHAQAVLSLTPPSTIASAAPAVAALCDAATFTLITAGLVATLALLIGRARVGWLLVLLLPFLGVPESVRTPGEFALMYAVEFAQVLAIAAAVRWFARRNYVAYAAGLWLLGVSSELRELYGNAAPVHFWTFLAIALAGVAWLLLPSRTTSHA